jgi:uncharacterized protein YjbI with pentapeptide repeats
LTGTLTNAAMGPTLKDLPITLDELMRQHTMWVSSNSREGRQMDVSGYDLRKGVNFSHAYLTMMKAVNTVFYGVQFPDAQLLAADMRGADLRHANLQSADMRGADFKNVKLNGASLQGGRMDPLILGSSRTLVTEFEGASLRYANFSGASLREANFRRADLFGANFIGADLTGAAFQDTNIKDARIDASQQAVIEGNT